MRRVAAGMLLGALMLTGCAAASPRDSSVPGDEKGGSATSGPGLTGEVTVFAAASLRTAFDEIAEEFEQQHPGVDVKPIVYDGSSTLVTQLQEGARADVLATADEDSMQLLVDDGLASDPRIFATNTLVVITPPDNPGGVTALSDLADAVTVLCAPEVPCGKASSTLLDGAGIEVTPASLEQNVTAVLQKVAAGEADAGLVYATDARPADGPCEASAAEVCSFRPENWRDAVNRYPVAALDGASGAGVAFAEFVRGPEAQRILDDLGFGHP
ncbi:molybdate ABC transporter substrate-binding protein [Microbacterium sp. NPDC089321]|uniref:molybdate ABC transporter substrate-binding protein n=1 Tax=Microbacterium sp. NPDC089321 TaxID=3155183 RepID=UPI00341A4280